MKQIHTVKRRKRNKKEQNGNLPVPFRDESEIIQNRENTENISAVEEQKTQTIIKPVLIPEETLLVEESRFDGVRVALEIIVTIVGLGTLFWFIQSSATQHSDSVNALDLARQSIRRADSIAKVSDSLQRIKDSLSLALTQESNRLTHQGIDISEKNMFLSAEISRTAIQPFIFVDTVAPAYIQNLVVGKAPFVEYIITNVGTTPAYRIVACGLIIREYALTDTNIISALDNLGKQDTVGWFLGNNKKIPFPAYFMNRDTWKNGDSMLYANRVPLLFICKIVYEDAFGNKHFTQQGFIQTIDKPVLVGLRKYMRTDHDKQTQTNK
jgi:hypothetical protein